MLVAAKSRRCGLPCSCGDFLPILPPVSRGLYAGIDMGCGASTPGAEVGQITCANGTLMKGTRCQTQWERQEGGNDLWFCGTVQAVYDSGQACIRYDDGDTWTGEARYIWLLPSNHPGAHNHFTAGSLTQAGPYPQMAQPLMQPVVMAQPLMQPMATAVAVPVNDYGQPIAIGKPVGQKQV